MSILNDLSLDETLLDDGPKTPQTVPQTFDFDALLKRSGKGLLETPLGILLAGLPSLEPRRVVLAGGALRRTITGEPLTSDLDFFFGSEEDMKRFAEGLTSRGYEKKKEGDFNEQWEKEGALPIQLIKVRFYKNPSAIINSFDYTLCQFVFDGKTLHCGELALFDVARKRIVLNRITYPVASLRRLLKYQSQGYYACSGTLSEILRQTASDENIMSKLNAEPAYID